MILMDFALSKEQKLIQKLANDFADKYLEPVINQIQEENYIPQDIFKALAEHELLGIPFSEEYGGSNAGYLSYVLALEQIAKRCAGVGVTISASILGLGAIANFGSEDQKKKY